METNELAEITEAPVKQNRKPRKRLQNHGNVVPRRTRAQVAPDWTVKEMLTLVSEVAAINQGSLKSLSSYQKWKMVSDNFGAFDFVRSSDQCRRKWEQLLVEYKLVGDWEIHSGVGSYWCLDTERKKEFNLPTFFDRELFGALDAYLKVQESESESDVESETEGLVSPLEMCKLYAAVDAFQCENEPHSKTFKSSMGKERVVAAKLVESAQAIHAIVERGEQPLSGGENHVSMNISDRDDTVIEFKRRQCDELIKVFGTLVNTIDQLVELVK